MLPKFFEEVAPRLAHRRDGFEFLVARLAELGRPVLVVETGTAREAGNWTGDGQSTLVWASLVRALGGYCVSIDINEKAIEIARRQAPNVYYVNGDSQNYLRSMRDAQDIDLLYLDSFDYGSGGHTALSELHHVGELAAIYERLKSGCLIAVDDCHGPLIGKHVLVKKFFERLEVPPVFESYVTIWKKP